MKQYKLLFNALNGKLKDNNLELTLHCIGGFVLEYHGLKATNDIDAFYKSDETIDRLIKEVGEENNLNLGSDAWLNNSIKNILSSPNDHYEGFEVIYKNTNLTVEISSLESVLIDKIDAGRVKDIPDIANILRSLNMKDSDFIVEAIENAESTDPSIVFEAYAEAFGEDELEEYLKNNPYLRRLYR